MQRSSFYSNVSKVEMAGLMVLIYKELYNYMSTFETPPFLPDDGEAGQ